MLFNSYEFIFLFLPLVAVVYFSLNHYRLIRAANIWMIAASLFFYAWWDVQNLIVLGVSIAVNYSLGVELGKRHPQKLRRLMLLGGIVFNIVLLAHYKYTAFIIDNINRLADVSLSVPQIILPLAISFFTFKQIAYLVDSYRHQTKDYDLMNYMLFACFFPELIAGPIIHHKDIIPQFSQPQKRMVNWKNIYAGLFLFSIGLVKKVVIADWLAQAVSAGYAVGPLTTVMAWKTTLSYTFQLYFDFSGYCDMALGVAAMFNIMLPINFNSPYKAVSIQDFWRRWHMTLSRWLRDYIYIPLGGNRKTEVRTYANIFIVFLIGGIWHGAGWTFVIWGALHGIAMMGHRLWQRTAIAVPNVLSVLVTFLFIHMTWVFFRAPTLDKAIDTLKAMFAWSGPMDDVNDLIVFIPLFIIVWGLQNSMQLFARVDTRPRFAIAMIICFTAYMLCSNRVSEFIYFNF